MGASAAWRWLGTTLAPGQQQVQQGCRVFKPPLQGCVVLLLFSPRQATARQSLWSYVKCDWYCLCVAVSRLCRLCCCCCRRRPPGAFAGNELVTSKYNLLNFVPVNLYHQFKRVANMYFAALVCLQVCAWRFSPRVCVWVGVGAGDGLWLQSVRATCVPGVCGCAERGVPSNAYWAQHPTSRS